MRVTRAQRRRKSLRPSKSSASLTGAVGLGVAALAASQAGAATFNVTNLNDAGAGSLRQAVIDANTNAGADVITFQPGLTGTITLLTGQLSLYDSVDIQGPGPAVLSVSGNDSSRVFYIYSPSATTIDVDLSGLTVTHGVGPVGGAIVIFNEDVTLDDMVITTNIAFDGGSLWASGADMDLTITDTQITGNIASGVGGGAYIGDTGGPLLIQDSIVSGNLSAGCGGGLFFYSPGADVTIDRTTISGNTTNCLGGGIYMYSMDAGTFSITNSTISGNTADGPGGGFANYEAQPMVVRNTTISGNSAYFGGGAVFYTGGTLFDFVTVVDNVSTQDAGGGILVEAGTITISNSIVANNTGGGDIEAFGDGNFDVDHSLIESQAGTVNDNGGNLTGTDPQLGPLANNGGPTQTHRPALTSPVIDAADPATTVPTDQRGQPREYPVLPDMGAVEIVGGVIQFNPTIYSVPENMGSVGLTVTRDVGPDPASVDLATAPGTAAGADYTTTSTTINFAAGDLSETVNVPILDDAFVEGSEQFTAALSNPSDGSTIGAGSTATVTITDVEPGQVAFSSATYSVAENGGSITITVNRSNGSTGAASVNYATSNGSASFGADYTTTNGMLNWGDGDVAPKSFNVPILDDALVEGDETFTVTLSGATGATIGSPNPATVTITDFETGTAQFLVSTATTDESAGTIVLTVTRTGGSNGPITVNYATSDGTATGAQDYTPTSGFITFNDGDTAPKPITIQITNDAVPEPDETFTVTLTGPNAGAPASTIVTISANDAASAEVGVPALDGLGKIILALAAALAGVIVLARGRILGILLVLALVAASAPPAIAANKPTGKHAGQAQNGKIRGKLSAVTTGEGKITLAFQGGESIVLDASKVRVIDMRGMKRMKVAASVLAAGQQVVFKPQGKGGVAVVRILG